MRNLEDFIGIYTLITEIKLMLMKLENNFLNYEESCCNNCEGERKNEEMEESK